MTIGGHSKCIYVYTFNKVPPPSCPTTLKMKVAWKQPLIKSLYLKLLVTVKHGGREMEDVSDWWSELQASKCVHAGFILSRVGPLLLLLPSTFLLSPFISASPSCPHLLSVLIPPLLLRLLFCCSFKAFSFSPIPKVSPSSSLRTHAKIYIKTYEPLVFLNILLHTRWYCDLPHTEIGCGSTDLLGR